MNKYLRIIRGFEDSVLRKKLMKEANRKYPSNKAVPLSESEMELIKKTWDALIKEGLVRKEFWKVYSFYKYFGVINENLAPSDFYLNCQSVLNKKWSLGFLSHKANLHLFIPEQNRPRTIIYKINGHIYDDTNNIIDIKKASRLLLGQSFVYKKALMTGGGKGVKKYDNANEKEVSWILGSSDYIIQGILKQNTFFSELNESSVNTIRMETLNINGTCSVLSSFIRIGAKGSFVDNISGREGMVVGIDEWGKFSSFGLTRDYEKVYGSSSGKKFEGLVLPEYERIKETIKAFHRRMPLANLINWDISIDEEGVVKIIEINLDAMNPLYHQIFNGPIFKDRTKEVMDYVIKHKTW